MFGSDILGVAIGIVFIYLLGSLVVTTVNEWISRMFAIRAKNLEAGIRELLDGEDVAAAAGAAAKAAALADGKTEAAAETAAETAAEVAAAATGGIGTVAKTFKEKLFEHPLVFGTYKVGMWDRLRRKGDKAGRPSYIDPKAVSAVLFDEFMTAGNSKAGLGESKIASAEAALTKIEDAIDADNQIPPHLKKLMQTFVNDANTTLKDSEAKVAKIRKDIETWFDGSMSRVSGWYKRKMQTVSIIVALGVAIFLNIDSIAVTQTLWNDQAVRDQVVASAEGYAAQNADKPLDSEGAKKNLEGLNLPIGWDKLSGNFSIDKGDDPDRVFPGSLNPGRAGGAGVLKWIGLLVSGIAISLGSQFWFDILGKLINLRGAGGKPNTTKRDEDDEKP